MTENLLSIVFTLKSTDATSIPLHSGRIAQGAVLAWLQRYKPELAVKMHDHYQRLYTVSGLQGALKKDGRWLKVAKGESLWFRFTALHPEIIDAFLEIAARLLQFVGRLPKENFVELLLVTRDRHFNAIDGLQLRVF